MMRADEFQSAIAGLPFQKAEFFDSIGSTNDVVAQWARDDAAGICLAVADEQIKGRGRSGRQWFTPPGSALAFSLLLDQGPAHQPFLGRLSGLGALAVCEGLENLLQLEPKIKWPNDVLLEDKKVSGVLAEAHWVGERLQALILGIGINVTRNAVPPAGMLDFPATSVEEVFGGIVNRGELLRSILQRILLWRDKLDQEDLLESWEKRTAYLKENVYLHLSDAELVEGVLEGIDDDGSLRVQMANGDFRSFQAGDIHLRPHPIDIKRK